MGIEENSQWRELYERRGNINCKKYDLVNKQIDTESKQLDLKLCDFIYLLDALIFCHIWRAKRLFKYTFLRIQACVERIKFVFCGIQVCMERIKSLKVVVSSVVEGNKEQPDVSSTPMMWHIPDHSRTLQYSIVF